MSVSVKTPWFGTKKYIWVPIPVTEELPTNSNPVFVIFLYPLIEGGLDIVRYSPDRKVWETYKERSNMWITIEGVTHWLKMVTIAERNIEDLIIAQREYEIKQKLK